MRKHHFYVIKLHNFLPLRKKQRKTKNNKDKQIISLKEKVEELEGKITNIKKQLEGIRNDSIQNGKALSNLQNSFTNSIDFFLC